MRKKTPHLSGFILTLVFVLSGLFLPQISHAQTPPLCTDVPGYAPLILATGDITCVPTGTSGAVEAGGATPESGTSWWTVLSPLTWLVSAFGAVSIVILKLAQLITGLSGLVLNFVVQYSVVEMKARFDEASINDAWKVIRDVGNMGFIFVLLYAAIMTIIGQGEDNQKLIVRIVIVAILINFSLFFTKFVIDVSNILAMMFYDAIAPGSLSASATTGLSNSLMAPLKLQSILNVGNIGLQGERLLIIGVMGTIVSLIVAFVLFAISILFLIRFVVLIFVVILSPIAFISFVLPNMDKYREQWKDALLGQAFFAPIYFMLTWVVIKVSRGLLTSDGTMAEALQGAVSSTGQVGPPSSSSIGVLVNFIIMIALLIFSLVAAKEWAGKAGGQVSKLTSWATGAAGDKAFGGLGWAGRTTLGRGGAAAAESARLQEAANKQRTGGWDRTKGAASRLALYASKKAGGGTYDARNATIPTSAIGATIEGTVGRTKIGKAMGLNDVPIPSIQVGAFAAGQTGVGEGGKKGFVDTREESRKRVEAREKARDDDYRKAQTRLALKKGMAVGASPAEITEMQRVVKDMSNKEIAALEHNTLANEKVAEALTAGHLKAINDSEKSEPEKREVFNKHFAKVATAAAAISNPTAFATLTPAQQAAHRNTLRNISEKEMDYVPTSIFDPSKLDPATAPGPDGERSRAFLKTLTQPQVDNLTKGDKLIASEKQSVKDARNRPLNTAFTTANWIGSPDSAVELMREMRPETLVQLDDTKLTDSHILELYSPPLLNKMAARSELTEAKALAIRTAILNAGPGAPGSNQEKSYDWLLGDGLNIF